MKIPPGINTHWKKDIFIDVQIANKFASPPNIHYVDLIIWITTVNKTNPANSAALVLSEKLINKYISGNALSQKSTSIGVIINNIIATRRFNSIGNDVIKEFKKRHIYNNKKLNIRCNSEDKDHLPLIFYSVRKMALIDDTNFINAVLNFPPFSKNVRAARQPELLPYNS